MKKVRNEVAEKRFLISLCDMVITGSVALIFFAVPIFFTGMVAQGFVFEKVILMYLLVLLGLVAWITKGVATGELNIVRTPLDIPLLVLGVILLVSATFSVDPMASFVGSFGATAKTFIAFLVYVTFYYIVVNNVNRRRLNAYVVSFGAGAVLAILYAALQLTGVYLLPIELTQTTSFNSIGSSSSLGIFVAAVLPLLSMMAPGFLVKNKESAASSIGVVAIRVMAILGVIGGLFVLFLLNNFVIWWIAVLGMAIVLVFILSGVTKLPSRDTALPIAVFLVLMMLLVGGNFNLVQAQLPAEVSLTKTLSWNIAKESLKRDPLFGSGLATFDYSFIRYRGSDFNASNLWNVRFDASNGSLFELLATVGVLGAFGFIAVGLIVISVAFISLTKSGEKNVTIALLGIIASLIILTLNTLVASVSGTIVLTFILLGVLTMAFVIKSYPEKFKEFSLSFRSSPKYALALSSLFLLVSAGVVVLFTSGFKIYLADVFALKAASAQSEEAIAYLERAIATTDYQDQYYLRLARLYMSLVNQELAQGGGNIDANKVQNFLSLAISAGKRAVELAPNSVVNKETLALIYENAAAYNINGALQWAEKYYTDIIAIEPDNPTAYIRLAIINMTYANAEQSEEERTHFLEEALKFYQTAIEKKGDLAAAHYGRAVVQERLKNMDQAVQAVSQAVALAPNNIDYRYEAARMLFNRGVARASNNAQNTPVINPPSNEEGSDEELDVADEEAPVAQATPNETVEMNEDLRLAEGILQQVISVSPNHANAVYSLALVYEITNQNDQARTYYERLLDIVPDQTTKDAILQKISNL